MDFPSKQLNTCCKIRSYIQAFIKWLKVDVVLFVNQRCSFWIGRNAPQMDVCYVNLTCHYCNYLWDVFTWYFCVAIQAKTHSVAVNVPQRTSIIYYIYYSIIYFCARVLPDASVIIVFIIESSELCWGLSTSKPTSKNSCFVDFCFQVFFPLALWIQWWWCRSVSPLLWSRLNNSTTIGWRGSILLRWWTPDLFSGWHVWLFVKCFDNYWMDCFKSWYTYSLSPEDIP